MVMSLHRAEKCCKSCCLSKSSSSLNSAGLDFVEQVTGWLKSWTEYTLSPICHLFLLIKSVSLESLICHFLLTTINVTKIPHRTFPEGLTFNGRMHCPERILHSPHSGKTMSMLLNPQVKGAYGTAGKAILHKEGAMSQPAHFCKWSIKYLQIIILFIILFNSVDSFCCHRVHLSAQTHTHMHRAHQSRSKLELQSSNRKAYEQHRGGKMGSGKKRLANCLEMKWFGENG